MKIDKKPIAAALAFLGVALVVATLWFVKNGSRKETARPSDDPLARGIPEAQGPGPAGTVPSLAKGPLELTGPFDLESLRSAGLPLIIDFGADSCVPCKEMAPVLVDLHKSLEGKAIIRFVDVWKYRDLAQGIPLQVIPTQIFFDAQGKPFTPDMSKLEIPFTQYSTRDTNEHVFTTHEGGLDKAQMLAILAAMGMRE